MQKNSNVRIPACQRQLRKACQTGNIREVDLLLSGKHMPITTLLYTTLTRWLLRCLGVCSDPEVPSLDFVYEDDGANLAVHYIAAGPASSWLRGWLPWRGGGGGGASSCRQRAELVTWLRTHKRVNFEAVNGRLETTLHLAVRSGSTEVVQALLAPGPDAVVPVSSEDAAGQQPLDLALLQQQWPLVRLLVAAGALAHSSGLASVRKQLQGALPPSGAPPRSAPARSIGLISSLSLGLGRVVDLVLGQGEEESDPKKQLAASAAAVAPALTAAAAGHRQQLVARVAYVVDLDAAAAAALLELHAWDDERAIEAFLADPQAQASAACGTAGNYSCAQASSSGSGGASSSSGTSSSSSSICRATCMVCFEGVGARRVHLPCGHVTCDDCWKGILAARLDDGDVHRTVCPSPGCKAPLPSSLAEALLAPAQWQRFERLLMLNYVDTNPHIKWCPRPGCGESVSVARVGGAASLAAEAARQGRALDVTCPCGTAFCFTCLAPSHEPAQCDQMKEWGAMLARMKEEAVSTDEAWVERNTKPCPGCKVRIQKSGGCNHMTCRHCRHQFCWLCEGDWTQHSLETGGYYSCNRFRPPTSDAGMQAASASQARGLLGGVLAGIQDAAAGYRLGHFLRRYSAHEVSPPQLHRPAARIAQLLAAGLPPDGSLPQPPPPPPRKDAAFVGQAAAAAEGARAAPASSPFAAPAVQAELQRASSPEPDVAAGSGSAGDGGEEPYAYLAQLVAALLAGRRALQCSYVLGYHLGWGGRRRHFEELQGRLEVLTEQLSQPLGMLPLAVGAGAGRGAGAGHGGSQEGALLRQQFFFAVAVHERGPAIRTAMEALCKERERLCSLARRSAFSDGQPSADDAASSVAETIRNVAGAFASFLERR